MSFVSGTGRKLSAGQTGELCTILILCPLFVPQEFSVVCDVLISLLVGNVVADVFYQCLIVFKLILYDGVDHYT
jgi:hypothetical protein